MEKKCKYCAMMIPKDAKICAHCRKKQGMGLITKIVLGFIVLAGLGAVTQNIVDHSSGGPQKASVATTEQAVLTEKGKQVKAKHSTWSNETCNSIAKREITIGMTKDQVVAAWGKPRRIMSESRTDGDVESWFYGYHTEVGSTLSFGGDTLAFINQTKRK